MHPSWDCLIDGVSIGPTAHFAYPENNWVFCSWGDGVAGKHTLTVQATTLGQTFWVDKIEYVPLPEASVPSVQAVAVQYMDGAIHYGAGWATLLNFARFTTESGTTVEYEFEGKYPFLLSLQRIYVVHRNQVKLVGVYSLGVP